MRSKNFWQYQESVPGTLGREHEDIRAQLGKAAMEPGPIGHAARRIAQYCLPHFELEERIVFPAFGVLHELASGGEVRPEMAEIMKLIDHFGSRQAYLAEQHHAITSTIEVLQEAARGERNGEIAEFANKMLAHEKTEEDITYPVVLLIGRHIRDKLKLH